ncbi:MAG TPA: ABC transporter permease [Longimicrobiales bacterium]|nr:ABC transporter permease [Longimicrobiales bacterium]
MPDWTVEIARRLSGLSLRAEREAELSEEIAQHLDDLYQELRGQGLGDAAAAQAALRELDATGGIAAQLRGVEGRIDPDPPVAGASRRGEPLGNLWRDVRYAARQLARNRVYSAAAIITLALGIGLNTAVFSTVHALLFRPLPGVHEPDRLVQVYRSHPTIEYGSNSIPHFNDVRARARDVFAGVAAWRFVPVHVSVDGRTARVMGQLVSADFFAVLGARMAHGRGFLPEEAVGRGAHPVAVLGHGTWRTMFGGDPTVVGRTVVLNGRSYEVVGVAGAGFRGPIAVVEPALWVPLMQLEHFMPGAAANFEQRGNSFLLSFARLQPDVTVEQARARMATLVAELREEFHGHYDEQSIHIVPQAEAGMNPQWQGAQRALSAVLMAVVAVLLLIACVNVANLMLARARQRSREMAVRLSLGAGRGQLVRQLLIESLLLALIAGAAALLLARLAIGVLNGVRLPFEFPISPDLRLSGPVLAFTLAVSLVTGFVFGLVPALQATAPALVPALKGESLPGGSRARASRVLVVVQMALSLVLLIAAGLFVRSLAAAVEIETGFDDANVLIATVDPGLQGYDRARAEAFYATLGERLRAQPSVVAVGFAEMVPLGMGDQQRGVAIPGYVPATGETMSFDYNIVTPGYFEAMGIATLRGRVFTGSDAANGARVVVINEQFGERFWPGEDPVGRTVVVTGEEHTVIGVVPTGRYHSLGEAPKPYYYLAQAQWWNWAMTVHVRTAGDPARFEPMLRAEVRALDPDLPLADMRTMTEALGFALLTARLAGTALAAFGLLGLLLAAIGIYGVMAQSVTQRTREIGIRMAVGAAHAQVVGALMRQGLTLVAMGAVLGLAGGWGAWRLVRGMLHGTTAPDVVTFTVVPLLLIAVAACAIWIPARRAARVDPVVALRTE